DSRPGHHPDIPPPRAPAPPYDDTATFPLNPYPDPDPEPEGECPPDINSTDLVVVDDLPLEDDSGDEGEEHAES
ncbi:hypothetical protein KC362_g16681, partial [Hortaea werneckii]